MSIPAALLLALFAAADAPASDSSVPGLDEWHVLESGYFDQARRRECASRGASGSFTVRREADHVIAVPRERVRSQESSIFVPGTADFAGRRAVLERPKGVWLGIDRTELGGGLWWLPRSGAAPERVSHENVRAIVEIGGRVTALAGLAFMTWDQGALLQPERGPDGVWRLGRIVPLGAAPLAFGLEADAPAKLWIVTTSGVSVFDGASLERRHPGRYRAFEPDSIALDAEGRIFIGMRHLVARLSPARRGYHEDWLVPPWCRETEPETCACMPGRNRLEPGETDGL